jgi:hypothetical protein
MEGFRQNIFMEDSIQAYQKYRKNKNVYSENYAGWIPGKVLN